MEVDRNTLFATTEAKHRPAIVDIMKVTTAEEIDNLQVDIGSVQEIEKIKITNRTSCCKNRAIGIKAVILGADGTTVIKETPAITTMADTYTFTFPDSTAWT